MTFKSCKYEEGKIASPTQIQWDTKLNAFVEEDGRLHDRKRCESIRGNTNQSSTQRQTQQTTSNNNSSVGITEALNHIADRLDNIVSWQKGIEEWQKGMTESQAKMVGFYADLVQVTRALRGSTIDPKEEELAQQEERYDQDKEDGLV